MFDVLSVLFGTLPGLIAIIGATVTLIIVLNNFSDLAHGVIRIANALESIDRKLDKRDRY